MYIDPNEEREWRNIQDTLTVLEDLLRTVRKDDWPEIVYEDMLDADEII